MNISELLHRAADLRVGDRLVHHPARRLRLSGAAARPISGDRAALGGGRRGLSRRLGRDDGRDDRGADRAGDQRRRGHALHALELEPGADLDHRHLPARHRHRYRAGAGPEPGRARRAAPARSGAPDRRHRHQAGDRLPDGRGDDHDRSRDSTSTMSAITPIRGCATGCCACRASARCRCSAAAIIRCASGSIPTGRRRAISPPTRSWRRCEGRMSRSPAARSASRPSEAAVRPSSCRSRSRAASPIPPSSPTSSSRPTRRRGAITRLRDVARVEIGSQDYGIRGTSNRRQAVFMAIQQLPGSNALETAAGVLADLEAASRDFPQGMEYSIPYNPTEYVQASVEEVQQHPDRGGRPRRPRHRHLPADMARRGHSDHRHPGLADRHLRGAARARLLDQHAVAVRARAGGRHRRRRRDRRRRGGREAYPRGPRAARRRAPDDAGDFGRADRDRARARRRVRAGGPDLGHSRHLLPPVRGHHRRRRGDLDPGVADPVAGARGDPAEAAPDGGASREGRRWMRPLRAAGDRFNRGFDWLSEPLRRAHLQAGPSLDDHAGHLWRPARPHGLAAERDAHRLHSGSGSGLPDRRHPASARRRPRSDRGGGRTDPRGRLAKSDGDRDGGLRRPRRLDLQPGVEQRHHVPAPRAARGAARRRRGGGRAGRPDHRRRRRRGGRRAGLLPVAAAGAGPRQWQRLRDDAPGPRAAPAIRRSRARPSR